MKRVMTGGLLWLAATMAMGDDGQYQQALPMAKDEPEALVTLPTDRGEAWPFSYTLGYQFGARLRHDVPGVDLEGFMAAFREGYGGVQPALSEAQMRKAVMDVQEKLKREAEAERAKVAADNLAKAKAFLASNAKRKGVKVTATGLQYEVLAKGKGESPKAQQVVKVNYHGTLPDGTVFDSTQGGEPAEFPLSVVIKGWVEGLQLMNKGAKYKFFVPPELGYGERGNGEVIPPNQALVFEVELLDFHDVEGTDPSAIN